MSVPNVYKVTYPNGKIYIRVDHLDLKGSYFGSPSRSTGREIDADFTPEELRDFTVRKEILWESEDASKAEATKVEAEWIQGLQSNNPAVGYKRNPKWTGG